MPARPQIKVEGTARRIEEIFRFDKELWKEIQAGVKDANELAVSAAKRRVPDTALSNWDQWTAVGSDRDLSYEATKVRGSIRGAFRSRRRSGFRVISAVTQIMNPAGAIFTLAGSRNRSGEAFNINVNRKFGGSVGARNNQSWPRILGPAWYESRDQVQEDVGNAVEQLLRKVNR
jgi:hypothetical protein